MQWLILSLLFSFLAFAPPAFTAGLTAQQTAAICQSRSTCTVKAIPAGSALTVVAVHLGLKDKPDDAPGTGCQADNAFDGGMEYWLLNGATPPTQLLKLCNDGYGAAGVGSDEVTVGPNRLVHKQIGGSAWRWTSTVTSTLAPWRAVTERDCAFHTANPLTGIITEIDFRTMSVRSIAKDSSNQADGDIGCPEWPPSASQHFTAEPAPKVFGAYNIVAPILGHDGAAKKLPAGTVLGNCVPAMTTAGAQGFIVFGTPAPAAQAAELRVVAESLNSLVIQVFDPMAGAAVGGSWVNLPHVEIWIGLNAESVRTRLQFSDLAQQAVDLEGKVYAGVGKKEELPSVERWQARDATGRAVVIMRLTWTKDVELLNGVAIVYSQAEAGKQTRMVANTGIVKNHPLYVPEITDLSNGTAEPAPSGCEIRDGRLVLSGGGD